MMRPMHRDGYTQGYPPAPIYTGGAGLSPQQQQMNGSAGPQMQQGLPGPQGGQPPGSDGQSNPPPPEMNLANVLHYLQSEWRRWERDRNEWEIERAEMRARIALLEGQRRSAENLKVDLLRRVKMLEFALRQERSKASSRPTSIAAIPPSRLASIKDDDQSSRDEKEGSGSSEGGDDLDRPKPNGTHAAKAQLAAHRPAPDTTAWKTLSGPPRDPEARARSREYLKQCLQEIGYLTSPGALNPLPTRAPVAVDEGEAERPRKALPEGPIPPVIKEESEAAAPVREASTETPAQNGPEPTSDASDAPPSPTPATVALPEEAPRVTPPAPRQLTAIYRPESKAAWRADLAAANEAANEAAKAPWPKTQQSDEEQLSNLTLVDDDTKNDDDGSERIWTTRRALKGHLDIVRCVAIGHGPDLVLATGGDDSTVKVWILDAAAVMSAGHRPYAMSELEPVATMRGHTMPVTSVAVSGETVFSGSMDSTIRLWRMPATKDHDPYAPFDAAVALQTLEGHTDVVWDLVLLSRSSSKTDNVLVSVSSDGSAKIWEEKDEKWILSKTLNFGATPTCAAADNHDYGRVLVGLSNGRVTAVRIDDGEMTSYGDEGSQVNGVLSHPTLPLIITGHEDGQLRFYDTKAGTSSTLMAHPAPITGLALSPLSPMCILSASVDCSVRLWDIQRKTSLQDLTGHRQRFDEGVTHVASHPELPVVASAGADGVVRLWGAG